MQKFFLVLRNIYKKIPAGIFPEKGLFSGFCRLYSFLHYKILRRGKVIKAVDGLIYELDLDQLIDSSIYFYGCFEPDTVKIINKICKAGMTVFDIGANIGCHAVRFAKLTGPEGKVIAFEPMSWSFEKLRRNADLNGFKNLILEKRGISDKTQAGVPVYFTASWPLIGAHNAKKQTESVDFVALDDYMKQQNIMKCDIIKLDVDGYEFKALSGARETLKNFKPIIIMELCPDLIAKTGDDTWEMIKLLLSMGYKFYSEKDLAIFEDPAGLLKTIRPHDAVNVIVSTGAI